MRTVVLAALVGLAMRAGAADDAPEPSDHTLALERGPGDGWNHAVLGLLNEEDELPVFAISSVAKRFHALEPRVQRRVVNAFARSNRHPAPLSIYLELQRSQEPADLEMQRVAREALYSHRGPGAMDALRQLALESEPHRIEAIDALISRFNYHAGNLKSPLFNGVIDPVLDRASQPEAVFDRRYIDVVDVALTDPSIDRRAVLAAVDGLDTPGMRRRLAAMMADPDPEVGLAAAWALAKLADLRGYQRLVAHLEQNSDEDQARELGRVCGSAFFLELLHGYREADGGRQPFRAMIEAAATSELLGTELVVAALPELENDPDPFIREIASRLAGWQRDKHIEEQQDAVRAGVKPLLLVIGGLASLIVGILLFVWAWRLFHLVTRTRNRPVSRIASLAMGPVALEGEVQPAGKALRHPLTGEPCIYYAGADKDHPQARFYIEDRSGRVLVDPRGAVLFSDDGVLVPGERVHLVGFAARDPSERAEVMIAKDETPRPFYRSVVEWLLRLLFGFGTGSSVTRMLFSDPARCFWIWDDLERRPMGEARDMMWIAGSVLAAGVWIALFAVAALALLDQELSATLARAFEAGL